MNISEKDLASAKKMFANNEELKVLFVNKRGEFFSSHNMAMGSVKTSKDIAEITRSSVASTTTKKNKETKKDEKPFVLPTIEELKAKGDKLPDYIKGLKRDQLFKVTELIKIEIKGNPKNIDIAETIIKELSSKEKKSEDNKNAEKSE